VSIDLGDLLLLPNKAIYLRSINAIAFSDVHIGVEYAMAQQGLFIPPIQYRRIRNTIETAIREYKPKKIIIVGDLKHTFSARTPQEYKEVIDMLNFLKSLNIDVILVRGNHDNFIRGLLERYDFTITNIIEIGKYIFLHGHKNFLGDKKTENKMIIIGHIHPTVSISDSLMRAKLPAFLVTNDMIVLPAMTPLLSGLDIISGILIEDEYKSPLLGDMKEYSLYAVIGGKKIINFGNIGDFIKAHTGLLENKKQK